MSFGRWPRAAWAALSLAGVLLAGCSGDDEPPAPLPGILQVIAPERAEVDQAAEFGANADATGNGLSHQWDFGDGSSSSEARPHHAYATAGSFEVRLIVRNEVGEQRSARAVVQAGRYARVQALECSAADHAGWCWQQPTPRGSGIFGADFVDAQQGWSVGEAGLILVTQDGGAHWQAQASGTQRALRQVRFLDARVGFAAGDAGTLLRTEDGGQHWTRWWLESAGAVSLTRLWVPDARTLVVAGVDPFYGARVWSFVDGRVVRNGEWVIVDETLQLSAEGRLSWFAQQTLSVPVQEGSSEGRPVVDSQFYAIDVRQAFGRAEYRPEAGEVVRAGGAGAGGRLWVMLGAGPGTGHIVGLPEGPLPPDLAPVLLTSDDVGSTWRRHEVSVPSGLQGLRTDSVRIFDGQLGWAWSGSRALLRTDDGGATWRTVPLPGSGEAAGFMMMGLAGFFGSRLLSVALTEGSWLTTDGGQSWQVLAPPSAYFNDGAELRQDRGGGLVSSDGWTGQARRSVDLGRSWQTLGGTADTAAGYVRREQLWFGDAQHGLHLANGRLMETRDGGLTWHDAAPELSCDYCGMQVQATRDGALWRERRGQLARSTDQGRSWVEVPLPPGVSDRYYLAFTSAQIVWAQSPSGVYRSLDGGLQWQRITDPLLPAQGVRRVGFADARNGVFIATSGDIWRSADGGDSWQRAPAEAVLSRGGRIVWTDAQRGWIFDSQGQVLRTQDAGASWQSVLLPVTQVMHDVFFVDAAHGWMVGDQGMVLATTDGGLSWTRQASGTERTLTSVWAIDAGTAWVAGDGGVLLTTATGGR